MHETAWEPFSSICQTGARRQLQAVEGLFFCGTSLSSRPKIRVLVEMDEVRTSQVKFHRIQKAAGIHLPCDGEHEHTARCHLYGFHDEQRGFATVNHGHVSDHELQRLMRHRDRKTTLRYKNMTQQTHDAADRLLVPDVLKTGTDD